MTLGRGMTRRVGMLVNPDAGLGGRLGFKGSDGRAAEALALEPLHIVLEDRLNEFRDCDDLPLVDLLHLLNVLRDPCFHWLVAVRVYLNLTW